MHLEENRVKVIPNNLESSALKLSCEKALTDVNYKIRVTERVSGEVLALNTKERYHKAVIFGVS